MSDYELSKKARNRVFIAPLSIIVKALQKLFTSSTGILFYIISFQSKNIFLHKNYFYFKTIFASVRMQSQISLAAVGLFKSGEELPRRLLAAGSSCISCNKERKFLLISNNAATKHCIFTYVSIFCNY